MRHQPLRFLLFLLFLALLVVGLAFWKWKLLRTERDSMETTSSRSGQFHPLPAGPGSENHVLSAMDAEFTELVARIIPSVVSITTTDEPDREAQLRQFFGLSGGEQTSSNKMGSGMIVSPEGYLVTNWHVIKEATEVTVQLNDGRALPAALAGFDQRADIAVLKVEAEGLTPISFGDSEQVRVGQMVFAVGNPFGLQETVTQGIISAKGRRSMSEAANEFFQTSTLINSGNSGGPLIDINGKVIGINNFIISRSGGAEGLGFAIPSNVARRVYEDIINHGRVIRPWFGVVMRPLNATLARQLGLPNANGALVAATLLNSPAEKAGVQEGDVITSFHGHPIRDWIDLRNRIAETEVGQEASFILMREGKILNLKVLIKEEPRP